MFRKLSNNLYQACEQLGFTFIDNRAVNHNDLWNYVVHLLGSVKTIIADNLLHNINQFLQIPIGRVA